MIRNQIVIANISAFLNENIRKNGSFSVPILGVSPDRDIFWLFSGLVGVLGYFITSSLMKNEAEDLVYVASHIRGNDFRAHLVLSTQILGDTGYYKGGKLWHSWVRPIIVIYVLPIIISFYILLNEMYVTDYISLLEKDLISGHFYPISEFKNLYFAKFGICNDIRYSPFHQLTIFIGSILFIIVQLRFLYDLRKNINRVTRCNYRIRQGLNKEAQTGYEA